MSESTRVTDSKPDVAHGEKQGSVAMYVWIGVILAVLTFVEVAVYLIEAFEAVEVPILIILSTAKLILVVMYFMHLKMDHRALTWLFMSGVVLAVFMVSALIVLYQVLPRFH
ncbi:MAG: cytochrome C oxidase subunit IV [Gemmatimonadales bacterium]|nr:MAG: cytochrome C oxidase subunit IV [Gemmatimonadales bacterium]